MNNGAFTGRLTRDPETRFTNNQKQVTSFSIAVAVPFKRDEALFLSCEAWGKDAENISLFFQKGSSIEVAGFLREDKWQDKTTGLDRSKIVLSVKLWSFCPVRKSDSGGGDGGRAAESYNSAPPPPAYAPPPGPTQPEIPMPPPFVAAGGKDDPPF